MVTHGLEVTEGELEPGDLIFYSYEQNGQFRNISHVAIYVGNGRMVHYRAGGLYAGFRSEAAEASPSRRKNAPHGL